MNKVIKDLKQHIIFKSFEVKKLQDEIKYTKRIIKGIKSKKVRVEITDKHYTFVEYK